MDEIDKEVQRFARLLQSVVLVSRVPARQIERRLDYGAGTLNRVFNGRIELKMRHILARTFVSWRRGTLQRPVRLEEETAVDQQKREIADPV
jgi:hypothetical protein